MWKRQWTSQCQFIELKSAPNMASRRRKMRKMKRVFKQYCNLIIFAMIEEIEDDISSSRKRLWTRPWLLKRDIEGGTATLLREFETEDLKEYRTFMRMGLEQFDSLLEAITPKIKKTDTILRAAIPAKVKLQVTLCFLATGASYRFLQYMFRVSQPAISKFIPEVLEAIYEHLKDYIKVPKNHEGWKVIENGFNTRWNFPGCHGSIDGKHVTIQAPPNCGSEFWNYKGSNSVVLLAIVDHDYCFRYISVGSNGRNSDGGIFRDSLIYEKLENGLLPHGGFLVGDDAFPLKTYLLKPYSHKPLTLHQKIFNYRLSRARRIVENAFGILASRFRIFQKPIMTSIEVTDKIVRTTCALHNWLRITSNNTYLPQGSLDIEDVDAGVIVPGSWRQEVNQLSSTGSNGANRTSRQARELREKYTKYFNNSGAVPWQNRMVH